MSLNILIVGIEAGSTAVSKASLPTCQGDTLTICLRDVIFPISDRKVSSDKLVARLYKPTGHGGYSALCLYTIGKWLLEQSMIEARQIAERLGGPEVLGTEITSDLQFYRIMDQGFAPQVIDALIRNQVISRQELNKLAIAPRTLARRRAQHELIYPHCHSNQRVGRCKIS